MQKVSPLTIGHIGVARHPAAVCGAPKHIAGVYSKHVLGGLPREGGNEPETLESDRMSCMVRKPCSLAALSGLHTQRYRKFKQNKIHTQLAPPHPPTWPTNTIKPPARGGMEAQPAKPVKCCLSLHEASWCPTNTAPPTACAQRRHAAAVQLHLILYAQQDAHQWRAPRPWACQWNPRCRAGTEGAPHPPTPLGTAQVGSKHGRGSVGDTDACQGSKCSSALS